MSNRTKQQRLSFEALEEYLCSIYHVNPVPAGGRQGKYSDQASSIDPMRCVSVGSPRRLTDNTIANFIGKSRALVHRWRHDGIPLYSADAAAVRAGTHPIVIWGDEFYAGCEDTELV